MPRKSDGHLWRYYDLPPTGAAFAGQHPRPAQRCARCGMVRMLDGDGHLRYRVGDRWDYEPEPPCTPERPAEPILGP